MDDANVLTGKVLDIEDDIASLRLPSGETVEAMADHALAIDDLACICIPPDRLSVLFPRVGAHAQAVSSSPVRNGAAPAILTSSMPRVA